MTNTFRRACVASLALASVVTLSACGNDSAGDSASKGVDAASSAGSAAGSAASAMATDATSAAAPAASDASSKAAPAASAASSKASAGASGATSGAKGAQQYTLADVQKHATASDCWAAIKAPGQTTTGVYNLTDWIKGHPGGPGPIQSICGTDGTQKFVGKHGPEGPDGSPEQTLEQFKVGTLKG